jgi:nucleotide-binding universal stress UspA family protein
MVRCRTGASGLGSTHHQARGVQFTAHHATSYTVDKTIVDEAQKAGADMIVMVMHGRSRVGKTVFGSHTKNVIIESPLPVLVLR